MTDISESGIEAAPGLFFIVGKMPDNEWRYLTGPAPIEVLRRVLPGWQERTPSACIVTTHPPASREEGLIDALAKVRDAILSPINSLAIVDTVWMPVPGATYSIETLVDFIDAQIALIPTKPEAKEEGFPWEISPDAWRQVVERIVKETERVYGPGPVVNAVRAALQSKKPE